MPRPYLIDDIPAEADTERPTPLWTRLTQHWKLRLTGFGLAAFGCWLLVAMAGYHPTDPSWNAVGGDPRNLLGTTGAVMADLALQSLGWAAIALCGLLIVWGSELLTTKKAGPNTRVRHSRFWAGGICVLMLATAFATLPLPRLWPLVVGLGGVWGDLALSAISWPFALVDLPGPKFWALGIAVLVAVPSAVHGFGLGLEDLGALWRAAKRLGLRLQASWHKLRRFGKPDPSQALDATVVDLHPNPAKPEDKPKTETAASTVIDKLKPQKATKPQKSPKGLPLFQNSSAFRLPPLDLLAKPSARGTTVDEGMLRKNARALEGILADFGVKGTITHIRPGPVVTLYELEPAPGVKSSRVIALADDIARSMSAVACRVAVVTGKNAIGIELPNPRRETVYLRGILQSEVYETSPATLPLTLGETIGGESVVVDLAKMPHLLIAGTTGSGKSVGVNAMILSILYRLPPEQCRFIMIDPKMLELSVYDGIPHLLAPVVTDPKKAVAALKWTVREMEDRYRRMSKVGVRNIHNYNERANECQQSGESISRTVQTGYDEATGEPQYETEEITPEPMPYLVVVIDEMADLMLVAGKDIEGAVQRLAQMARAAGIHLITATQRPSVDVITGTIKANFPTRISFQVTSKIDSRTILGEQGAEQLLGMGDMLYMAGGGRIERVHGPFVADKEVEKIAAFLKSQGAPTYYEDITAGAESDEGGGGLFSDGSESSGDELYDKAVAIVARDRKASTSYIQRRLSIGYNKAANLIERMEDEGVVSAPNSAGKREIFVHDTGE